MERVININEYRTKQDLKRGLKQGPISFETVVIITGKQLDNAKSSEDLKSYHKQALIVQIARYILDNDLAIFEERYISRPPARPFDKDAIDLEIRTKINLFVSASTLERLDSE